MINTHKSPPPLSKAWWEEVKQAYEKHPGYTHICQTSGHFRTSYAAGGRTFKAIIKLAQTFIQEKYSYIAPAAVDSYQTGPTLPMFPYAMSTRNHRLEFLDWNINRLSK